jgi:transcriptional regulator with XRE-family HTH domain
MPYAIQTLYLIRKGPRNLGNTLGRLAVDLDLSVARIARATGATRQTVYNWMFGGDVMAPYRPAVERVIAIMKKSSDAEKAWEQICQEFNLPA